MAGPCVSWWGFIFAAWMIIFPILIDEQRVATRLGFQGYSIIIRKEGTAEWRTKEEMLKLQTHSGSIYLVCLIWSAFGRWWSPFGRKILFGTLFFLQNLQIQARTTKAAGPVVENPSSTDILKFWRIWRMDTLQGLRKRTCKSGKTSITLLHTASKLPSLSTVNQFRQDWMDGQNDGLRER